MRPARSRKGVLGLMRTGRGAVLVLLVVSIMGTQVPAAPWERGKSSPAPDDLVAMTIELSWSSPGNVAREKAPDEPSSPAPAAEISLGVTAGQVVEVVPWPRLPDQGNRAAPRRGPDGDWLLGAEGTGRLRARLEVTLGTELVVHRGEQVVRMPVVSILERPQHTPDQSPLTLSVERLPWDSLAIEMGQGAEEGVVPPATSVPVVFQYNILWPEASEVNVRTTAILRPLGGTEVLWKSEERELVPANRLDPPPRLWKVPAPGEEGTFVLEVRATWEPSSARDTSRLGRLIRRRKTAPVCSTATRRVLFSVVSPYEQATSPARPGAAEIAGRETEVDSVDLTRIRSTRFSAWGRSPVLKPNQTLWELPAELLHESNRREHERLLSLITRTPTEISNLGPADESGLSWAAVGLRPSRPGKPHRLSVTVTGGDPTALGMALVDAGAGEQRPQDRSGRVCIGCADSLRWRASHVLMAGLAGCPGPAACASQSQPVVVGTSRNRQARRARQAAGPTPSSPAGHARNTDHGALPDWTSALGSLRRRQRKWTRRPAGDGAEPAELRDILRRLDGCRAGADLRSAGPARPQRAA